MVFALPDLPYDKDALEPHISAETLSFHHDKHHKAYVDKANELIAGTEYEKMAEEEIIKKTAGSAAGTKEAMIFNNAAQAWNHSFYWKCMAPNAGGKPEGELMAAIERDLGGYEKFVEAFKAAGATQFGSGWAWLVLGPDGKLKVTKTGNADLALAHNEIALLTMDVWEHAYYLDYQNKRPDYISTFLDKLINWRFVAENFAQAAQKKAA